MPITKTKQNNPQPGFLKHSAAFSVAWGDSPAGRKIVAGNEQGRLADVCRFTAVWGSPVWGWFPVNLLQADPCL